MRKAAVTVAVAIVMSGCAERRDWETPPCGSVAAPSPSDENSAYRAQAVVVGNRVLTAAHTFVEEGSYFPPNAIVLNGEAVWVKVVGHGDIETVRSLYPWIPTSNLFEVRQDWVAFEAKTPQRQPSKRLLIGDGKTKMGEALCAFFAEERTGLPIDALGFNVISVEANFEIPGDITFVAPSERQNLHGWSGCFVGRYHKSDNAWEIVGILLCVQEKIGLAEYGVVYRPPTEILKWLVGQ